MSRKSNPIKLVLDRLEGVKRNGQGYIARCPAHDDHKPSLSVSEGEDGRVLICCHAGCKTDAILAALGLEARDLFAAEPNRQREIVATYDYADEQGKLLFQVVRFDPKDFRQRRPDGADGWEWSLGDTRRVPYRLPEVLAAVAAGGGLVYVVEGEKDVHALEAAGCVATCNPGGAGKWQPEYSQYLADAQVIVIADKDEPGRQHATQVATSLRGKARSVVVVEAKEGKDAADHLAAGCGVDQLVPVDLKPGDNSARPPDGPFIDWSTFWDRDHSEADWVFEDVLAQGRGHVIFAAHKAGKSLFSLFMAAKLATSIEKVVVVYLDYEMTETDIFERLEDMGHGPHSDLRRLKYALLPCLPPLNTTDGAAALMTILDGVRAEWPQHHLVVVIDTIDRAVKGKENDADTIREFYACTGIELKRRGVTWVRIDREGKNPNKGMRGTSGKGDDVDVAWRLEPTENGICLCRELSRIAWVPEKVTFGLREDPLRYIPIAEDWPAGTQRMAEVLDRLGVPLDASVRGARKALKAAGEKSRNDVLTAAVKWRRQREGTIQ